MHDPCDRRRMICTYIFDPKGADLWDPPPRIQRGQRVVKVQPPGCPRNGTMGHCFVADAETGEFLGLVLVASLIGRRCPK